MRSVLFGVGLVDIRENPSHDDVLEENFGGEMVGGTSKLMHIHTRIYAGGNDNRVCRAGFGSSRMYMARATRSGLNG